MPLANSRGERQVSLRRRALALAIATVAYNVAEAVLAISFGLAAGSAAIVGFGLDSTARVASALINPLAVQA